MRRLITVASLALAFVVVVALAGQAPAFTIHESRNTIQQGQRSHRPGCRRLFTVRQAERAIDVVYGPLHPSSRAVRHLQVYVHCQRNPQARGFVRGYLKRRQHDHAQRVQAANPANWPTATASQFDDSGATACGFHADYGVAHLSLPCGTRVQFAYHGNTVTAVVEDRGPYIAGREWDLANSTADALGFNGVDTVSYRVLG